MKRNAMNGTSKIRNIFLFVSSLAIFLGGCAEPQNACDQDNVLETNNQRACVYRRAIIEEGFECPQGYSIMRSYGDLIICSKDDNYDSEFFDALHEEYDESLVPDEASGCAQITCNADEECSDGECYDVDTSNEEAGDDDALMDESSREDTGVEEEEQEDLLRDEPSEENTGTDIESLLVPTNPKGVAAGAYHTCAIVENGEVMCWGGNRYGQLGVAPDVQGPGYEIKPVKVPNLSNVIEVSASKEHTCALLGSGAVYCWGTNFSGQLGDGSTVSSAMPVQVANIHHAVQITTTTASSESALPHSCALLKNGTVYCWGANHVGQLGDGTTISSAVPVQVANINNAVQISAGNRFTCAVLTTGRVKCWGDHKGTLVDDNGLFPGEIQDLLHVVQIAAGERHACALLDIGEVKCWGYQGFGLLGVEGSWTQSTPVQVPNVNSAVSIDAGQGHTCVVLNTGDIKCWGASLYGQSGVYSGVTSEPTQVEHLSDAKQVAVGGWHTCARLGSGEAKCWGVNYDGRLGNGAYQGALTPIVVPLVSSASQVVAGEGYACANLESGTVACWGREPHEYNYHFRSSQAQLSSLALTNVSQLSAGAYHLCALLDRGEVKCWGRNTHGEIGDGTTALRLAPAKVQYLDTAVQISSGRSHNCVVVDDGSAYCWGANIFGQLGNRTSLDHRSTPLKVYQINDAIQIAAGGEHTCALLESGQIKCWGRNHAGQLGDSTTIDTVKPVIVEHIDNAVHISAGYGYTCAVLDTGEVKCWGRNHVGQLGNGTYATTHEPVLVTDVNNAVQVSTGDVHTCAVLDTGEVKCWGSNVYGQLGSGIFQASNTPTLVAGITNVVQVDVGSEGWDYKPHTCAVLDTGEVKCWGSNFEGQLARPSEMSATPVSVLGF